MKSQKPLSRQMGPMAMAAIAAILMLAGSAAVTTKAAAAESDQSSGGLSRNPPATKAVTPRTLTPLLPYRDYTRAQYATGGVALRNRARGVIGVSGAVGKVQAAYLYWAVIINDGSRPTVKNITLVRSWPSPAESVALTGIEVGSGDSPCWGVNGTQGTIKIYRASVPLSVANGNGTYVVVLNGASGLTGGQDPWDPVAGVKFPLFEGASLVIIGTGESTVAIYDKGLSGRTFFSNPGISYSLPLPATVAGEPVLFDNIGADGQHGESRSDIASTSREVTTINGIKIAGPGSPANDSDWNGSSGFPLPQLWDDTGHDITAAAKAGTTKLNVSISAPPAKGNDCLTPVANVVSFPPAGAASR
ncbi:MAG: hypothetical protein L0Y50_01480 [Beijerinckiaceae bacterium]|nr:hypothetical protein [Beijerinckiaceae bacterium]